MLCRECKKEKLSREFPEEPPSDGCSHPPHFCLECMVKFLQTRTKCPFKNCNEDVPSKKREEYQTELKYLFPPPSDPVPPPSAITTPSGSGQQYIIAMLLNGEHRNITFAKNRSIVDVKSEIEKTLRAKASKQKLLFGQRELKAKTPDGGRTTLGTYGVTAGSTIRVMVQLCEVPVGIQNAVFNLYWGYPKRGRDYLDASALFFRGHENTPLILDYCTRPQELCSSATHSGDVMDDGNHTGHHTITILSFEKLPPTVTNIFFVLSSWNSPTIAHFESAALAFYEKANPGKLLCENHVKNLPNVQAKIMCRVDKDASGQWEVFDMGRDSGGNAMNYKPLIATIRSSL